MQQPMDTAIPKFSHTTRRNPSVRRFMIATGIECSYPTNKDGRYDEMETCKHYEYWETDLHLVHEMEIRYLRYGPPYYRVNPSRHVYNWDFVDEVYDRMFHLGIVPLTDLCHFGVPDWIGNFQNPEFPEAFAHYAGTFARRYPWVRFYTPVNEMYICALFSARYGWWNERLKSERAFVTALKHIVKANVMAMEAILEVRDDAIFIQSESSEVTHASRPEGEEEARRYNQRRFLSLDLNYGYDVSAPMYRYLLENGLTPEEYDWFMSKRVLREYCVMGNDYYITNEHLLQDGVRKSISDVFGYYVVTSDYYNRYNLPIMHTETNRVAPEAVEWLWKQWANVVRLRADGVPLLGFTWYSLTDQTDWNIALRAKELTVNTLGLYDLDRKPHPVQRHFARLVHQVKDMPLVPNGPLSL